MPGPCGVTLRWPFELIVEAGPLVDEEVEKFAQGAGANCDRGTGVGIQHFIQQTWRHGPSSNIMWQTEPRT